MLRNSGVLPCASHSSRTDRAPCPAEPVTTKQPVPQVDALGRASTSLPLRDRFAGRRWRRTVPSPWMTAAEHDQIAPYHPNQRGTPPGEDVGGVMHPQIDPGNAYQQAERG